MKRLFALYWLSFFLFFLAFAISVFVLAMFIDVHHWQLSLIQRLDSNLLGLNIPYFALVVLIPFFQGVLSGYSTEPMAYALYALVIGAITQLMASCSGMRIGKSSCVLPYPHAISGWRTGEL